MSIEALLKKNVNEHVEKKNGLSYLSWAWAWAEALKADPKATYKIEMFGDKCFMDINGTAMVFVTVTMFDNLKRLITSQPYIEDFCKYAGEVVDIDFDLIRQERYTNQPRGSLNRWFNYVFPQMASDLSQPYLNVKAKKNDKIIINFTQRYRNHLMEVRFLPGPQKLLL